MKRTKPELTEKQKAQLDRLADLTDDQIDTSDIPETVDWSKGIRGMFYRPVRQEVTIQMDKYMVDWFRQNAPDGYDYKESIIQALWEHIRKSRLSPLPDAQQTRATGPNVQPADQSE